MFGKGQTSCILGNAKVANNWFLYVYNKKLLMCWKKNVLQEILRPASHPTWKFQG